MLALFNMSSSTWGSYLCATASAAITIAIRIAWSIHLKAMVDSYIQCIMLLAG